MQIRQKIRIRAAVDAIVGGVIGRLDQPEALILGRWDDRGRLRVAGRSRPLRADERAELAGVLAPPQGPHPWPPVIPASRFGQLGAEPVAYTKVRPDLVVEVDADVCWEQDRWRHPVAYRRLRIDLAASDVAPGRPV
ncbi:hypothetical protein ACFQ34_08745 [Pseudonocardia benzenivorans]|uniref:Uncharacterized protein n=1 Tax=Pseudonocardia benzenivorans TaxID=228005 RepID=A0ABW3VDK0_9PSEU